MEEEEACGEGMTFTLGQEQMIEDFDQGVAGLGAGEERTFDAVFPEDYRVEELQGKEVEFTVKVLEVNERKLPELDDEFYAKFGIEEGGEAAFREEVRNNMQRELEGAQKNQVKQHDTVCFHCLSLHRPLFLKTPFLECSWIVFVRASSHL